MFGDRFFPIFVGRARRQRRYRSTILPIDATDKQLRRARRRQKREDRNV